jgi:gluconolactonase
MTCRPVWVWGVVALLGCGDTRGPTVPAVSDGHAPTEPDMHAPSGTDPKRSTDEMPEVAGGDGADAGDDAAVTDAAVPEAVRSQAARICPAEAIAVGPTSTASVATLVRDGFDFLEGPVWIDARAELLFSDMNFASTGARGPGSRIWRLHPPDAFDVFVEDANSNGLAIDAEGLLLACTHDVQSLSRFDPATGERTPLELEWRGQHFNSPNDLVIRSDGNVYFTDPDWQLGTRSSETEMTGVYRVTPAHEVELIAEQLEQPNGIALSPDERTLYVGSAGSDIMMYSVADDGAVRAQSGQVFASPGASDGMAVDCAGNLYVAAEGAVQVFSPAGGAIGRIDVSDQVSNMAFGDSDHRTLYITAGAGLYAIRRDIPGLPY